MANNHVPVESNAMPLARCLAAAADLAADSASEVATDEGTAVGEEDAL